LILLGILIAFFLYKRNKNEKTSKEQQPTTTNNNTKEDQQVLIELPEKSKMKQNVNSYENVPSFATTSATNKYDNIPAEELEKQKKENEVKTNYENLGSVLENKKNNNMYDNIPSSSAVSTTEETKKDNHQYENVPSGVKSK